ncbi:MAG: DUF1800 domain-containing protein, partial [Gammaproteobacteria bacterium]|nr:DUF1800 domain-containing protein [Gammaproteobacteria bacterium]
MQYTHEEPLAAALAEDTTEGDFSPPEQANSNHRAHAPVLTAVLASTALAACGGGGSANDGTGAGPGGTTPTPTPTLGSYAHPVATTDREAARFLLHAQFSASPAEIAALRATTFADWLDQQFATGMGQTGWDWLNQRGYDDINSATAYYDNSYPADAMIWHQLMTSTDGLRKRVALALSEICVVSLTGLDF